MKKNPLLKNILVFCIIAFLYFCLSRPFSPLIFTGATSELRLSGFLPMLSGLLFGPLGAVACAVGNFLGDLIRANVIDISDLFGSVGVFLMGYLPYKLWHGTFASAEREPAFFSTASSVLKYVLIALIASVCASAVVAIGGQLYNLYNFARFFGTVVLQYFDLSILIGMLLFHLLTSYAGLKPHIPLKPYERTYIKKRYAIDHVLWAMIMIVTVVLLVLTFVDNMNSTPTIDMLCILLLLLIAAFSILPMTRSREKIERAVEYRSVSGLRKQFMFGFLLQLCAILIFCMFTMIIHMLEENERGPALWIYVLSNVAGAAVLMVLVLFVILKWIETHVTQPVCETSNYAANFVKGATLSAEDLVFAKTGNEIDELGGSIRHMTDDIRSYVEELKKKTAAEERLAAEMNVARSIQMGLLPRKWQGDMVDIHASIEPAREVGGDFYDFHALPGNKIFVAIADVSGKGISAALFMMCAKTLMNTWSNLPTGEMMERINAELASQNDTMMFVTMFAGVVDCTAMTFTYVNAGHNPPIIFQDGALRLLDDTPDFVVGPIGDTKYTERTIPISKDFKLLIYTDGVTEAQNVAGDFLGDDRLMRAAKDALFENISAQETTSSIQKCVAEFAEGAQQADDITILCLLLKQGMVAESDVKDNG